MCLMLVNLKIWSIKTCFLVLERRGYPRHCRDKDDEERQGGRCRDALRGLRGQVRGGQDAGPGPEGLRRHDCRRQHVEEGARRSGAQVLVPCAWIILNSSWVFKPMFSTFSLSLTSLLLSPHLFSLSLSPFSISLSPLSLSSLYLSLLSISLSSLYLSISLSFFGISPKRIPFVVYTVFISLFWPGHCIIKSKAKYFLLIAL